MRSSKHLSFGTTSGGIVNPNQLSAGQLERLRIHLPQSMSKADQDAFLLDCSDAAGTWTDLNSEKQLPLASIAAQIEEVERTAQRLERAILALSPEAFDTIGPQYQSLRLLRNPTVLLSPNLKRNYETFSSLLIGTLDMLDGLQDTGKYTRSKLQIDRTSKPSMARSRSLAFWVITKYRVRFSKYPSCEKVSWFPALMTEIGDMLEVEGTFGPAMLTTIIRQMKKESGKVDTEK